MSSDKYSACLPFDPVLRRWVLASGFVFSATGVALIVSMPIPVLLSGPAIVLWLALSGREIRAQRAAYARYRAFEMDNDEVLRLLDAEGQWHDASLLPGSLLLLRVGWIRIRDGRGRVFGEPLRGSCRGSREWRRLQLIWRHVGAHA